MEKQRKIKMLSIIALVIMIVGMSLGFAAFSNTLTISSSAKVTPTDDALRLVMYGFTGESEDDFYDLTKYTSTSFSNIVLGDIHDENLFIINNKPAVIDNDSLTLNIGEVEIKNPGNAFATSAIILNNGDYDVYIDMSKFSEYLEGECAARDGTSEFLVTETCTYIKSQISLFNEVTFLAAQNGEADGWQAYNEAINQDCFASSRGVCKLEKGSKVILNAIVTYITSFTSDENNNMVDTTPRADGSFTVSFPDVKLEFTTDSTGYVGE